MVLNTQVPSRAELAGRAADIVPLLQSHATWGDENRRLHQEAIEALASTGVFRMRVPARYGGFESDAGTLLEVTTRVAMADGSASWNLAVWSISAWLAGQFPDHVQDEVFAVPDVRICGVLSPTAQAVPADGGSVVNGQWHFISGALHSQWQVILAMAPTPDGADQWPIMALVPMSDLEVLDDWHTTGLRGTGSVTTLARDVFVPQDRMLPMVTVLQDRSASELNPQSPVYRAPMMVTGCTSFSGTAIGLAKAVQQEFMARLDRKITYTDYPTQREAPVTHLQVAEAALKIEEAESHAIRLATLTDTKSTNREAWTLVERARARAYLGRVFQRGSQAADTLNRASGGHSIYTTMSIQRMVRDLHALSMHALMHPSTNAELYGRVLCGLNPNTVYI